MEWIVLDILVVSGCPGPVSSTLLLLVVVNMVVFPIPLIHGVGLG